MTGYRLAALDLDGTLFLPDHTISERTAAAVRAARDAGWVILPATGRPPHGLADLLTPLGPAGDLVVCNGAAGTRPDRSVIFEDVLTPEVQRRTVEALSHRLPGAYFAVVRNGGYDLLVQDGYPAQVRSAREHLREPSELVEAPLAEVIAEPCVNLIVRHHEVGPREIAALLPELGIAEVTAMYSNDALLEIQPAGVSKATGVGRVCAELGIRPEQVVAFGDSQNDLDLLAWAGHGVAMGNASAAAKAIAAEVTSSNLDDGVAVVLERLVGTTGRSTS